MWGYDEITWFAHQTKEYRSNWLNYALDWIKKTDPNGFLEMPGSRTESSPLDHKQWYYANMASKLFQMVLVMKKLFGKYGWLNQ